MSDQATQDIQEKDLKVDNQLSPDQEIAKEFLDKQFKVIIKDDREFYGTIVGLDKNCNLILNNALECIPMKYVTPINEKLNLHFRDKVKAQEYIQLPEELINNEEELEKFNQEFRKNKFKIGQSIIPGHQIKQILQQKI